MTEPRADLTRGIRLAGVGLLANTLLAVVKGLAGVLGNSYALIADALESVADIGGSLIVLGGLRLSSRSADQDHPYGHGKAEPLAAAVVGIMLAGAAIAIGARGLERALSPHEAPEPFTLAVLVVVVFIKETLFRRVVRAGDDLGSGAVIADAWHHRADAFTSLAAFVGIGASVVGGAGYEWCDGAAAVVASFVILYNALRILRPAVHELMDGAPDAALLAQVAEAARGVAGVRQIEKLMARKVGTRYLVDLHVQADPGLSLHDAHILGGCVKTEIRRRIDAVENVLVHMEPYEP